MWGPAKDHRQFLKNERIHHDPENTTPLAEGRDSPRHERLSSAAPANLQVIAHPFDPSEKAAFEKGRSYVKMEKYQDAVDSLTLMIKKYQKSDQIKEALFLIGESYEKLNNPQKAVNFYQKVIGMPPRESINNKAKQRVESLRDKL